MRDVFQGISGVLDRTTKFLINKFSSIFLTVLVLPFIGYAVQHAVSKNIFSRWKVLLIPFGRKFSSSILC